MVRIIMLIVECMICQVSSRSIECAIKALTNARNYLVMDGNTCYIPSSPSLIDNEDKDFHAIDKQKTKIFKRISNNIILFRIVSHSGRGGAEYFMSQSDFNRSVAESGADKGLNYKNLLLEDWEHYRPQTINVTLGDISDNVVAWLYFNIQENDSHVSWFSLTNLNASYPWMIAKLKVRQYTYFSIIGLTGKVIRRSIYIHGSHGSCSPDVGVMGLHERPDSCPYVAGGSWRPFTSPKIIYGENNGDAADFNLYKREAKYLEMVAIYSDQIKIMIGLT